MHYQSVHQGIKYPCLECDYEATRKDLLSSQHESVHQGRKYSCELCGFQAKYQSSVNSHHQSVHQGLKYPCHQCDYQATQKSNIKRHIQTKHSIKVEVEVELTIGKTEIKVEEAFKLEASPYRLASDINRASFYS